jgi:hypothetical protein
MDAAWARHAMCKSAFTGYYTEISLSRLRHYRISQWNGGSQNKFSMIISVFAGYHLQSIFEINNSVRW